MKLVLSRIKQKTLWLINKKSLLCFLCFYLFVEVNAQEPAPDVLMWNSEQGKILETQSCNYKPLKDTSYQVVIYTGNEGLAYENIRTYSGTVIHKLANSSLVIRSRTHKPRNRYDYVKVVGSAQTPEAIKNRELVNTAKDDEVKEGYVFSESLHSIKDYTIEVVKGPPSLSGGQSIDNTLWSAKRNKEGSILALSCDSEEINDNSPLVFNVYDLQTSTLIAEIAVKPTDIEMFTNIRVLTQAEGKKKFAEARVQNQTKSFSDKVKSFGSGVINQMTSTTTKATEDSGQTISTIIEVQDEIDPEEMAAYNEINDSPEEVETEEGEYIEEVDFGDDVPVIDESNLEYVVCTESSTLNVRSFNNIDGVWFKANNHETVIPAQSFGNDTKFSAKVGNEDITFIKVQFPNRVKGEEQIGWVAEEFVKETSQCVSYQKSLGEDQPIVCLESGTVNIRDESFEKILFSARQFENIAVRSDAENAMRVYRSYNSTYEMIPVNFPEKENQEGWVAKKFVKTKKQCEPYKKQGDGYIFPTAYRATQSYRTGMRAFGAGRDDGKRLHAAADIYRTNQEAVRAVFKGRVIQPIYLFYEGTFAIEVRHPNFVVRYGELYPTPFPGVKAKATVRQGQNLGKIKRIGRLNPMLHFEMYKGNRSGSLTNRKANEYERRSDIMNPTESLREWERKTFGVSY